ncbi:MAG TPA: phosphatidylcholine synthase [Thermoanaerobaculia bacterium]|nr:phosphatidylcholine synthase [Thermoanaerobaculia bacterium]
MQRGPSSARVRAWAVHAYTASGVVFALLAALEIASDVTDPRIVFLWLAVAVLVDATDGPLARRFDVKKFAPEIDGRKIDDIVDYLTFTFLPLLLVVKMEWVPQPALLFIAPPLIASLFGFANVGAKDERGGFFLGFPSYWNIVALYLGIFAYEFGVWPNAVILIVLSVLTVLPIGFIYPNLAPPRWKPLILFGAFVWLAMALAMLRTYPVTPAWLLWSSLLYPVFYTVVSVVEYRKARAGRNL